MSENRKSFCCWSMELLEGESGRRSVRRKLVTMVRRCSCCAWDCPGERRGAVVEALGGKLLLSLGATSMQPFLGVLLLMLGGKACGAASWRT